MRARVLLLSVLFPLSLSLACAKNTGASTGGSLVNDIEMTGIDALDEVFTQARDVDELLDNARIQLNTGRSSLNSALGLANGTPFADAISELSDRASGKLTVVMEGGTPTIQTTDAVPSNLQSAIDAANSALNNYQTALSDVTSVSSESAQLAMAIKELSQTITTDPGSLGLSMSNISSVSSTTQHNLSLVKNFPNRIDKLSGELVANLGAVSDAIKGGGSSRSSSSSSGQQEDDNAGAPTALPR